MSVRMAVWLSLVTVGSVCVEISLALAPLALAHVISLDLLRSSDKPILY
jgi:hypothetical protein